MHARARLLGHSVHQMLIVFPLGLLGGAVIFDIAHQVAPSGQWSEIAFWLIFVGVLSGLVAAVFGIIDWLSIPRRTRAWRIGLWHGLCNVLVLALFIVSWLIRRPSPLAPTGTAVGLAIAGLVFALVSGWLGGELVDRLGVGVDEGAHLNAPNSLRHKSAADHGTL
jgi:uncharacterized membrane protein